MFELHPQLAADCFVVGDLPLCRVLLLNDSQYPWLILVPRQAGLRELCELGDAQRSQYQRESDLLAGVLLNQYRADKLNIAALGNMVPQLHIHHIARYQDDACWPKPVWGQLPAQPYRDAEGDQRLAELREALAVDPAFRPL